MKYLLSLLVVGTMLMMGCNGTSKERLLALQKTLGEYKLVVEGASTDVEEMQDVIELLNAELTNPDNAALDATYMVQVGNLLAKATQALSQATQYNAVVTTKMDALEKRIDAVLAGGDVSVADEIIVYSDTAGDASQFLPPPWNAIVLGGSTLLTALVGAWGRRKQKEGNASKTASTNVIDSVTHGLQGLEPGVAHAFKTALRALQTNATRAEVKRVTSGGS